MKKGRGVGFKTEKTRGKREQGQGDSQKATQEKKADPGKAVKPHKKKRKKEGGTTGKERQFRNP